MMYEYNAQIIKVVDGDTVHANIDLGLDVHINVSIRLAGINAPEKSTLEGVAAKEFLQGLLPVDGNVVVLTQKDRREKYGRYLGVIRVGELNLNVEMVKSGCAVPYEGGSGECSLDWEFVKFPGSFPQAPYKRDSGNPERLTRLYTISNIRYMIYDSALDSTIFRSPLSRDFFWE